MLITSTQISHIDSQIRPLKKRSAKTSRRNRNYNFNTEDDEPQRNQKTDKTSPSTKHMSTTQSRRSINRKTHSKWCTFMCITDTFDKFVNKFPSLRHFWVIGEKIV